MAEKGRMEARSLEEQREWSSPLVKFPCGCRVERSVTHSSGSTPLTEQAVEQRSRGTIYAGKLVSLLDVFGNLG